MSAAVRHIVFDIGRVLLHYDPHIPYSRLIPDPRERQAFFETVCTHDWNLEQDRGRSWEDAEALLIERYPEKAALIRAFRRHWPDMVSRYGDTVVIMERLIDEGRDVTMLTNFADDTFAEALVRFPFLEKPRGVTVSARVRLLKPDPAIYAFHTERFELDSQATLFIDDSPANVEAARTFGWQAVQFTDAAHLRHDLTLHGVSV